MTLTGDRFPTGVVLNWSGSDAGSYQIWAFGPGHKDIYQNPVAVIGQGTTAPIGLDSAFGEVEFEARPVVGGTACPAPASALTVYNPPALSADAGTDGVALSWTADSHYGPAAVIGRGPDADHVSTFASASGNSFVDTAASPSSSFVYEVEVQAPNLKAFSNAIPVDTILAAPQVSVTDLVSFVQLSWTPVAGATDCSVTPVSPAGVAQHQSSGTSLQTCPDGVVCTYTVTCTGANGRTGIPATVTGHTAPPEPFPCSATAAIGGAQISWQAQPRAASYRIERVAGAGQNLVGNATGTSFVDTATGLFDFAFYRVVSVAADGVFDESAACITDRAGAVNQPAAMNLGPATESTVGGGSQGQSFVVAQGGQLAGIEVPPPAGPFSCIEISTSGDPGAGPRTSCIPFTGTGAQAALAADSVHGAYIDLLSQNILVSQGETIAFDVLAGVDSLPATSDVIAGTATGFLGSIDPAHDLIFKAYVLPTADLPAPQLTARSGGNQAFLTWTGSPAATDYEVLDGSGAVLLHTADTHAVVSIAGPPGSSFSVVAIAASGANATSNQVNASANAQVVDASNLCLEAAGAATSKVSPQGPVQQTFTVTRSGLLTGIEVAALATSRVPLPAEILDANGAVLATFGSPFGDASRPLSPVLAGPNAVDLSAKGIRVTAGQVLTLQLGPTDFIREGNIAFRDGADTYPGGAEVTNDGSARDLCFKVYVTP
ncbi:MAG TPA: hypothetical protein VGH20_12535 [Myxococcales bacterium]|jgi:hypothetical protein